MIVNLGAPARIGGASLDDREERSLLLLGRLHAGATRRQALAEVGVLWSQLAAAYPKAERNRTADLTSAHSSAPDDVETARLILAVLIAAALLTLSIACANAANLMLALATERRQEALIKTVLGASRRRLIGEFLKETAGLCAAAGVSGYAMALAALAFLSRFKAQVPVIGSVQIAADLHPGLLVAALTLGLIVLASVGKRTCARAVRFPAESCQRVERRDRDRRHAAWNHPQYHRRDSSRALHIGTGGNGLVLAQPGQSTASRPGLLLREGSWMILSRYRRAFPKEQGFRLQDELRRLVKQIGGVESVSLVRRRMPLGGFGGNDFGHEEIRFTDGPVSGQKAFAYSTAVDPDYFSTLRDPRCWQADRFAPPTWKIAPK